MIKVKQITYLPADIFAMFGAPQKVLDAPPTGKVNNILGISHRMVFSTLAYTGATKFFYKSAAIYPNRIYTDSACLPSVTNQNLPLERETEFESVFSTILDFFITTDNLGATGDSKVIAMIIYEQKDLEF